MSADRQYLAYWNPDVFLGGTEIVPLEFFTEDAGYTAEEIDQIAKLQPGEIWKSKDYGDDHTVQLHDASAPPFAAGSLQ